MGMTVADLKAYVSSDLAFASKDESFVAACWEEAIALIAQHVGSVPVPEAIRDRAVLEVGAELYHRRRAPNGITQFATPDGNGGGIRVARDPMIAARDMLAPFLPRGIA
ncbi:hypothetical protein [Microbacterium dextranolyticum]|uniref:Phage gp6-like head-tail connector protein n=1 Tax=Microbacterium dextranolyticum TaxID=36806 RepID=A0A9W6HNT5_9MICO|nr:hypothetical protein [Microbacterium dextranolyticum]MBM7462915.1 hypothetical protein [Microbacterium dextranolyticum]GLJ95980.1 hypothetical protein GCM10017591_20430 [Microbacterium dextranolyticum]